MIVYTPLAQVRANWILRFWGLKVQSERIVGGWLLSLLGRQWTHLKSGGRYRKGEMGEEDKEAGEQGKIEQERYKDKDEERARGFLDTSSMIYSYANTGSCTRFQHVPNYNNNNKPGWAGAKAGTLVEMRKDEVKDKRRKGETSCVDRRAGLSVRLLLSAPCQIKSFHINMPLMTCWCLAW